MNKPDNVIQIATFGRDPEWFLGADPHKGATPIDNAARAWSLLQRHDEELSTRLEAISHDENLSAKGRAKARQAAHKANQAALAPVRKVIARLANDLQTLRQNAQQNIDPSDALLAHLKAQEIRQWLGPDPLPNFIAANTAAEQGDAETLNAILDSPTLWPGRPSDDKLINLRDQRLENAAGDEATEEAQALAEVHHDLTTRLGIQLDEAEDNANPRRFEAPTPGPDDEPEPEPE